jgi:hypothetical protein
VFELCEVSSFHICFYVVSRLLGGEAIYAAINLLMFLSSVTFKRESEQCSETPVNSCQMTLRRQYLFTIYLKMLSVAQTTSYHLHNNFEKMKKAAVAVLKLVPQN